MFCRILCCFVAKSLFYAIYAVLSRNLFCRYLRALAWRKIGPKILSVEKKGQISGMPKRVKSGHLLSDYRQKYVNGTRDSYCGVKSPFLSDLRIW